MENKSNRVYFILQMNGKMSLAYSKRIKRKSQGRQLQLVSHQIKKVILELKGGGHFESESRSEINLDKSPSLLPT